jgi:hypothetical protein
MRKPKGYISPFERAKDPEVRKRIDAKLKEMLESDKRDEEKRTKKR